MFSSLETAFTTFRLPLLPLAAGNPGQRRLGLEEAVRLVKGVEIQARSKLPACYHGKIITLKGARRSF